MFHLHRFICLADGTGARGRRGLGPPISLFSDNPDTLRSNRNVIISAVQIILQIIFIYQVTENIFETINY